MQLGVSEASFTGDDQKLSVNMLSQLPCLLVMLSGAPTYLPGTVLVEELAANENDPRSRRGESTPYRVFCGEDTSLFKLCACKPAPHTRSFWEHLSMK